VIPRLATLSDAKFISRTVISSWQDAYRDFLPRSFLRALAQNPYHDRQSWEARIREPGSATWIISENGYDVGVLRITLTSSISGTDSQLTTLYLLQQARGHGLGSKALVFARTEVSRLAKPILGVCVLAGNERGRRFYVQRGAHAMGERVAFQLDEQPIIDLLFRFDPVGVLRLPSI
jgi:GNAT superfamily N-acetyltransferase